MKITITITANKDDAADFIKKIISEKPAIPSFLHVQGTPTIETTPRTMAERKE